MRKVIFAILLTLGMAGSVWADSIPQAVNSTTNQSWTKTVFNDSGSTLVHGNVVIWDNDDTEYDRSGYRYVTTTTTADDPHTAGVIQTASCPDQQLCEMVVKGWAVVSGITTLTEDQVVSTSTTAGRVGDATAGNNVCYLGMLLEDRDVINNQPCTNVSGSSCALPVEVEISCVP